MGKGGSWLLALVSIGCMGEDPQPSNTPPPENNDPPPCDVWAGELDLPDGFLQDPWIAEALSDAGMEPHRGSSPPAIVGTYCFDGRMDNGVQLESKMTVTDLGGGRVSYTEVGAAGTARSIVGSLTGSGSDFTLWLETEFNPSVAGAEAGLCSEHDAIIISSSDAPEITHGDLHGVEEIEVEGVAVLLSGGDCYGDEICPGLWGHFDGELVPPFCLRCGGEELDEEGCRAEGCTWGLICDEP